MIKVIYRKPHILEDLAGKICRLRNDAYLEDEFNGLNHVQTRINIGFQKSHNTNFRFIDEPPFLFNRHYFYCVAATDDLENWYWYSLNQLMFCKE